MMSLGFRLALKLTPAGEERARLAEERGEKSILGKHLPIRELSVKESGYTRTYFIGPVRPGGRNERLACFEIGIKR
jgi:hypothetical protein